MLHSVCGTDNIFGITKIDGKLLARGIDLAIRVAELVVNLKIESTVDLHDHLLIVTGNACLYTHNYLVKMAIYKGRCPRPNR